MSAADIPLHIWALALMNGVVAACAFLFLTVLALFLVTSKASHDGEHAR